MCAAHCAMCVVRRRERDGGEQRRAPRALRQHVCRFCACYLCVSCVLSALNHFFLVSSLLCFRLNMYLSHSSLTSLFVLDHLSISDFEHPSFHHSPPRFCLSILLTLCVCTFHLSLILPFSLYDSAYQLFLSGCVWSLFPSPAHRPEHCDACALDFARADFDAHECVPRCACGDRVPAEQWDEHQLHGTGMFVCAGVLGMRGRLGIFRTRGNDHFLQAEMIRLVELIFS